MAYEIKGTVKAVLETKQINDKFSKRSLVIEVPDGKYTSTLEFEATGDRMSLLDPLNPGDAVTIHFDLRGRAKRDGDGAWNSLNIWKLSVDNKAAVRAPAGDQDSIPF